MCDPILRGKVAKILNSTQLVINLGKNDGVEVGMIFDVLDSTAQEILDPDTHEVIGSLERPKIQVKIDYVQEKLSVAKTFKEKTVNEGGQGGLGINDLSKMAKFLAPPKYVTIRETLKTNEKTWENLDEKDSLVKTGDLVRLANSQDL